MTVTTPNPARLATRTAPCAVRIAPMGLEGLLALPEPANGIVLFAHGSGSSRFSPRNTYVAEALQEAGLGTLLFDLLTDEEASDRARVFEEPGTLDEAIALAREWFVGHLSTAGREET